VRLLATPAETADQKRNPSTPLPVDPINAFVRRRRSFVMTVQDATGVTHRYVRHATSLRRAKRDARRWVQNGRVEGERLVAVRPAQEGGLRMLLVLTGLTLVACGVTIIAFIVGLSLEGAL